MTGWFGSPEQVQHVLRSVGADKDEDGRFLLGGEPVFVGLDGDLVVPAGTEYLVNGKRANLAALLGSTSYGLAVKVL